MKRRSILISCVALIMALAVFVGCDNGPVYPHIAQSATLEQTATLLEGQVMPADAFKLTVSYLDGTTETRNVLPTGAPNGIAKNGVKVEYLVGYDGRGIAIRPSAQIVAYPVDHITAVLKDGVVVKEGTELKATDVTVTAYFYDGTDNLVEKVVSSSDIKWVSVENIDEELVATIEVGAFEGKAICTFEASATEIPVGEVASLEVTERKTSMIPQLNYETLPEVTDEMVKIVARDAEGKKIGQIPVADVEIEIVDPVTYLEFNGTDFATNNVTEVGVKVTYGEVIGTGKLTLTPVTLKVQPVNGFALVVGEEIGTPAAEDFIVDMYADTEFVQRLDSSDVELYYVTSSNDKYAANRAPSSTSAEIFVAGTYLGAETADTPDASAKIAVVNPEAVDKMTISAVSLAEDYKSPAKQYYTNIARDVVASVDDVASITFAIDYADETKKDVESAVVEADKLSGTLTVAYSTTNDKFTALAKEDDINKDGAKLYLYVTYTQDGVTGTYYVDLSSATSETAEITALELKRTYGTAVNDNPVYGSAVTYTVTTSNEYGDVERDVELTDDALDAYTVLVNDVQGTLPSVGETAQSVVVYLTADSRVISNAVEVEAGSDYIPDAQVGSITVSFSEAGKAKMLYVGDVISKVYEASDFVVSGYTSALNATTGLAEVVRVAVAAPEKATADTDAITVVYEYVAEDGTTATKTANVEVSPISWAAPSSNTLTLTYGEGENEIAFSTNGSTGLPAGTYNWTDFATNLVSYGIEADQVAKFAYTPSNANSSATSNGFTINDVYAEGTISVTYTAKDTAAESGVKETTVTFAVNGVAAN